MSAGDHQIRPGELEQALEEPGEHVRGRSRPPQGTRTERGQRAAAAGERRKRQTRDRVRDDRFGRGRQVPAIARVTTVTLRYINRISSTPRVFHRCFIFIIFRTLYFFFIFLRNLFITLLHIFYAQSYARFIALVTIDTQEKNALLHRTLMHVKTYIFILTRHFFCTRYT